MGTISADAAQGWAGKHRTRLIVGAVLLVLLLGVVLVVRALSASAAQHDLALAQAAFRSEQSVAVETVVNAEDALDRAIALHADSAGKVLTEQPRQTLADAIDSATSVLAQAAQELTSAEASANAGANADELGAFEFVHAQTVSAVADQLAGPTAAVTTAMAEWQSEQDRILRERYTNHVHAVGWTPELDECVGSVDVTSYYENVPTIAEHWSCGGKDFPDDAGTVITLTGEHAGTYRVEGIVAMLNADRDSTADLPRGHDLLYQTCQNGYSGTMSFTALTRLP